jgi:hypothetical protein
MPPTRQNSLPRPLSLVRLRHSSKERQALPFIDDLPLVFLGEIPNMPEHGVFAGHRFGRIYSGFHIWEFEEVPESEV